MEKILYAVIACLWLTVTIMLHVTGIGDLVVWYAIATPIALIRLWRAVLIIKLNKP